MSNRAHIVIDINLDDFLFQDDASPFDLMVEITEDLASTCSQWGPQPSVDVSIFDEDDNDISDEGAPSDEGEEEVEVEE